MKQTLTIIICACVCAAFAFVSYSNSYDPKHKEYHDKLEQHLHVIDSLENALKRADATDYHGEMWETSPFELKQIDIGDIICKMHKEVMRFGLEDVLIERMHRLEYVNRMFDKNITDTTLISHYKDVISDFAFLEVYGRALFYKDYMFADAYFNEIERVILENEDEK